MHQQKDDIEIASWLVKRGFVEYWTTVNGGGVKVEAIAVRSPFFPPPKRSCVEVVGTAV